jgi:hypothetical protein
MILITFHGNDQWPIKLDNAEEVSPELARNAYSVTVQGFDDLQLLKLEFDGLPMPRYINEWDEFTWYWTDAATIIGNIRNAALINKEATRTK